MRTGGSTAILCKRNRPAWGAVLVTLGGAVGVLSAPHAARAQAQLLPVRLKVGLVQPSDSGAKNIAGSPLYTGEIEVVLPSFLGPAGSSILTAGFQDRSTHGNELRVIPLTVSKTSDVPNPASLITGKVYYGAGIGAYILHAEKNGSSEDKTAFGGFGVVGYQLPVVGAFVELKYQLIADEAKGARPDGLLILIGKHL